MMTGSADMAVASWGSSGWDCQFIPGNQARRGRRVSSRYGSKEPGDVGERQGGSSSYHVPELGTAIG